jgi:hypothetical protein
LSIPNDVTVDDIAIAERGAFDRSASQRYTRSEWRPIRADRQRPG